MLVHEPKIKVLQTDPYWNLICSIHEQSGEVKEIRQGVYEIGCFGWSNFLEGYKDWPNLTLTVGASGVCDSVEQLLAACPELESSDREFVVTVVRIRKDKEPPRSGWRWCKWGEYIGTQEPQCEHLYDEPHIEEVLCYHIYEKIKG